MKCKNYLNQSETVIEQINHLLLFYLTKSFYEQNIEIRRGMAKRTDA